MVSQLELYPEKSLKRYTKTWCRSCGDRWGDENYLIGLCCGYELYFDYPMTEEDIQKEIKRDLAREAVIKRAKLLRW